MFVIKIYKKQMDSYSGMTISVRSPAANCQFKEPFGASEGAGKRSGVEGLP
jgi:hypothetical protein